jgi:hypothetical protein
MLHLPIPSVVAGLAETAAVELPRAREALEHYQFEQPQKLAALIASAVESECL